MQQSNSSTRLYLLWDHDLADFLTRFFAADVGQWFS